MDLARSRISLLVAVALLFDLPAAGGVIVSATRLSCGRGWLEVTVEVAGGRPVRPGELYVGTPACPVTAPTGNGSLILRYNLTACGTRASVEGDDVVYTNYLRYEPAAVLNIVRGQRASVLLECRYHGRRNVTSGAMAPTWLPYTSARVLQQKLPFSLRVVGDDWTTDYIGHYGPGDEVRVLATVLLDLHFDFLLFIDECSAMPSPSAHASAAEALVRNHGCLKIQSGLNTGHFQPRLRPAQLGFSFKAFGFQQNSSSQLGFEVFGRISRQHQVLPDGDRDVNASTLIPKVYLRCNLKVAERVISPNAMDKACSYTPDGWVSADGNDSVCSCCSSSCPRSGSPKAAHLPSGAAPRGSVGLGPLTVRGDQLGHPAAVDKRDLLRHRRPPAHGHGDSSGTTAGAAVAVVLLPLAATALVAGALVLARRLPLPHRLTPDRCQT